MGHEAVGRWLSDELGKNLGRAEALLETITQIEQGQIGFREIIGSELKLNLSLNNVEIEALTTCEISDTALQEDNSLYESESFSECGLLDFKNVLLSWIDFIR